MYRIVKKRNLAENVVEFVIDAPAVTLNAKPGQFIILRVDGDGERVPFTICDMDKKAGTVTILVQTVGYSTKLLAQKNEGGFIQDFVGPLGRATDLTEFKKVVMIGGGIGAAVIYPQAKFLKSVNRPADVIVGARTKSLIMYEDEFKAAAKNLHIATDDGSYGRKGFVTDVLRELLDRARAAPAQYDAVFAVGPMPMMKAVCELTKGYGVHTVVSMNATMVDGTGMCGGCRVTVGGKALYACVHGPEFDGHLIDWDTAINRSRNFREQEAAHLCKLK
ncbi:MAG: sulfide/dihydroorotate dehydrogenase-like FAD/NAD-binding protein [Clostridiales bacterium]|jgi:ferredoxin--NADP+ reductase|nr:sulfide/dihydroorotate dehydrogenase-like FAD/NAD-binding protein [Clostridiales bacterium]